MKQYRAFIFDLNGTMINDMDFHIDAWYRIFTALGSRLSREQVKQECYGKNDEVIERVFPGRFGPEEKRKMTIEKETKYQQDFRPYLKLIDGLDNFLHQAERSGIGMSIGSAAIMFNIDFVLNGLNLQRFFKAVVSADDVETSKPDPETFLKCASGLQVRAGDCLVFEDSPKGAEAASRAGMDCVVITTMHTRDEFYTGNIIHFMKDYKDVFLEKLLNHQVLT